MSCPPQRFAVAACTLLIWAVFAAPLAVSAPILTGAKPPTQSASGQFVISEESTSNFYRQPQAAPKNNLLQLQAPWLAVSAERFKSFLWRALGVPSSASWSGKIFIYLQPAFSASDAAVLAPQPFINTWNYRLDLPNFISRRRYTRALSATVLLELANRSTPVTSPPAELPAWLVDGLAGLVADSDDAEVILSAPTKSVAGVAVVNSGPMPMRGGVPGTRLDEKRQGLDPLTSVRQTLQRSSALNFDQLSWPSEVQISGDDGGIYLASAQLFVDSLLHLKNGAQKMRTMLAVLPECENWQSAFFRAFGADFSGPLEVEKWWALRVVDFAAYSPGPQWTVAISRAKLNQVLLVPIGVRKSATELPERQEISLQAAMRGLPAAQAEEILHYRLRELELVQLRLAWPYAGLAAGYCETLAAYLDHPSRWKVWRRLAKPSIATTLKRLDALDARLRAIETEQAQKQLPLPAR